MSQKATTVVENFMSLHDEMKGMDDDHKQLMEDFENGKIELANLKIEGDEKAASLLALRANFKTENELLKTLSNDIQTCKTEMDAEVANMKELVAEAKENEMTEVSIMDFREKEANIRGIMKTIER